MVHCTYVRNGNAASRDCSPLLSREHLRRILQMKDGSNLDQIAVEVHQLLQAVPDDCENPQALVLTLAQRIQDRTQEPQVDDATIAANAGAGERLIQNAFASLDRRTREILLLQLSADGHYRAIARRLNMPPSDVLRILREAYVKLRWHTESQEPPAEST
jgi:DNA-directed RNA polymerase specialized sigma24 family protein